MAQVADRAGRRGFVGPPAVQLLVGFRVSVKGFLRDQP